MTIAVLLALALTPSPARAADPLLAEVREHLKAMVRLDTSNPPGNELLVAKYLKGVLDKEGIESKIFISTGTRASLIARLKGSGAKRPLILMCHTDVVPADPKEWSFDPFDPVEKDGYIHGRGTADVKGLCASELGALLWLKRKKVRLARDVVFFAEADEETGNAERHIDWLLDNHGSELDAEFAINEGGDTVIKDGRIAEMRVQAAEKEYMDITLVARGTSGHSSVPRTDNAVAALSRAIARVSDWRPKASLEPVVAAYLGIQAASAVPQVKAAIMDVLKSEAGPELDRAADRLSALEPELGAVLRDTVTPTVLKAGYKNNVIPAEAEGVLNARLMPGRAPEALIEELKAVIDDPAIEVRFDPPGRAPVAAMPTDTPLYAAMEASAKELVPGIKVMPYMTAWTTDSADLRARGVVTYGIIPPFTAEDGARMHGKDERIAVSSMDWMTRFLVRVVLKVAAEGRPPQDLP